jgi:hypothetical protein
MRSPGRLLPLAAAALCTTSCVQVFEGSWIEVVFSNTTPLPGEGAGRTRVPAGTHFELWATSGGGLRRIFQFRIVPQLDSTFPCFIENEEAKFPGLHITQIFERVNGDERMDPQGVAGTNDGLSQAQVDRITDAQRREERRVLVEGGVKAIVGYDPTVTPAVIADLRARVADQAEITDVSDAANAVRFNLCEEFFDEHPRFYVGFDSVFSLPLNGEWYGVVEGSDPRTSAPLGGAGWAVPANLENIDGLSVRWDFDDPNTRTQPGVLCYFDQSEGAQCPPSDIGYYYMSGEPRVLSRRALRVSMRNLNFTGPSAEVAIFPSLGEDEVQF